MGEEPQEAGEQGKADVDDPGDVVAAGGVEDIGYEQGTEGRPHLGGGLHEAVGLAVHGAPVNGCGDQGRKDRSQGQAESEDHGHEPGPPGKGRKEHGHKAQGQGGCAEEEGVVDAVFIGDAA